MTRMTLSVRARVLLATMALVAVGLVASSAVTYVALDRFLVARLDWQLAGVEDPADGLALAKLDHRSPPPGRDPDAVLRNLVRSDGFVRIVDKNGHTLTSYAAPTGSNAAPDPLLPDPLPQGGAAYTVASGTSGQPGFRVHSRPVEWRGQTLWAVVGLSTADVSATLNLLLLIDLVVGGAVLAGVGGLGLWLVRLGLRPLDEIAGTATAIADGNLSLRVPDARSGSETGRLASAFNTMLERIEEAFGERQESEARLRRFIADASHELRTPLTSVRGYAELFRRGADRRPEDLARVMRGIEDEATRMSRLVEELLLLARLDQGSTSERHEVDLTSLARSAVEAARAADPERPLTLRSNGPVLVEGDGDRLRQVLDNLLGNVRVHTPEGTAATVRVGAGDGLAEIDVEDEGPGIPAEAATHVFERFYRVDPARSRHRGGHGLGLSIVAAITEAHGGTCTVTPGAGGGTLVAVRLPALDEADGSAHP